MEDASAVKMQDMIKENGIEKALNEIASIETSELLGRDIVREYRALRLAQCK
jgi:hypothetical protein